MNLRVLIISLALAIISNLSFSQTDSLIGKEVTIHFHKTKRLVTGKFKSYKNNRVTVLFDMSLHDYFYTEIKLLKFEELNLTFDKKGVIIREKTEYTFITNQGVYYGYILKEDKEEYLIETKSIGKLYLSKRDVIIKK